MKLKEIRLKNFRCYEDITIPLDEKLTVLVAPNGMGKTTILHAINFLLSPYIDTLQSQLWRLNIHEGNIRLIPDKTQKEMSFVPMRQLFPCSISVQDNQNLKWHLTLNHNTPKTNWDNSNNLETSEEINKLIEIVKEKVERSKSIIEQFPLLVFYGVNRGLGQDENLGFLKQKNPIEDTRFFAYHNCLVEFSNYGNAFNWFISLYDKLKAEAFERLELGETVNMESLSSEFTLVIQEVVDIILKNVGWGKIKTKTQTYSRYSEISLTHKNVGSLSMWQLSEGIRSVLGMVMDMAYRCCILNSHLGKNAVKETEGIVLIDEVDMHLHPEWQQTILADLQEAFPKIQFIVTTHSPQVLTTVPSKCIRIIDGQSIYSAPAGSEGAESSRLLNRIFKVESRPPQNEVTKWLTEYRKLVYSDRWDSERALELRHQLDEVFKGNEPELTALDLYIDNRKWELSLEENQ